MAKTDRNILEQIAVDMVLLSMEYQSEKTAAARAWEEVTQLSDSELINFITA